MSLLFTVQKISKMCHTIYTEAVVQRSSVKKVFLEISQNSHEKTCARVSFLTKLQLFSCEFCKISKNTFFYKTPRVAASVYSNIYDKVIVFLN